MRKERRIETYNSSIFSLGLTRHHPTGVYDVWDGLPLRTSLTVQTAQSVVVTDVREFHADVHASLRVTVHVVEPLGVNHTQEPARQRSAGLVAEEAFGGRRGTPSGVGRDLT